jgi:hypothetical protein
MDHVGSIFRALDLFGLEHGWFPQASGVSLMGAVPGQELRQEPTELGPTSLRP